MIKKLKHSQTVKLSGTLSGQRELIRETRNKINEVIDYLEYLEKMVKKDSR